ncbi:hypothetical protein J3E69DRAFT_349855 [Trichoderma sp. SZMC 28015]
MRRVDVSSSESIRNAVVRLDAVVSLIIFAGTATRRTLIDAIIEARVPNNRKYHHSRI